MKKEKMVLYLGYAALALIGLYFTLGILKISGEGLAKLGYHNNFIKEGFSEKEEEKRAKSIKNILEQLEKMQPALDKGRERTNAISDMEGYSEMIEGYKSFLDISIRNTLALSLTRTNPMTNAEWDNLDRMKKQLEILENFTV